MARYDEKKLEQLRKTTAETESKLIAEWEATLLKKGHSKQFIDAMLKSGGAPWKDHTKYGIPSGTLAESEMERRIKAYTDDRALLDDTARWDTDPKLSGKGKGFLITDSKGNKVAQLDTIAEVEHAIKTKQFDPTKSLIADLDNPGTGAMTASEHPSLAKVSYVAPDRPATIEEAIKARGGDQKRAAKFGNVKIAAPGQSKAAMGIRNFVASPGATLSALVEGQGHSFEDWAHAENMKASALGHAAPFPDVTGKPGSKSAFGQYMQEGVGLGAKGLSTAAKWGGRGALGYLGGESIGTLRSAWQDPGDDQSWATEQLQSLYNKTKYGAAESLTHNDFGNQMLGGGLNLLAGVIGSPMAHQEVEHSKDYVQKRLQLENKKLQAKERLSTARDITDAIGSIDKSRVGVKGLPPAKLDHSIIGAIDANDFDMGDAGVKPRSQGILTSLLPSYGGDKKKLYGDLDALVSEGKGQLGDANAYATRATQALNAGKSKFKPEKDNVIPLYGEENATDKSDAPESEYFLVKTPSGWHAVKSKTSTGEMTSRGLNIGDITGLEGSYKEAEKEFSATGDWGSGRGVGK